LQEKATSTSNRQARHATRRASREHATIQVPAERAPHEDRDSVLRQERLGVFEQRLVVDGSDNFSTRYLVNDVCVMLNKPQVHGSIFRFDGQMTTFVPHQGPCYRCLFPEPPPPEFAPSCQEAGVLGVLPGVIGVLEAIETIKIILGKAKLLTGRLIAYDALNQTFKEMKFKRDPNCAACGPHPMTELPEYSEVSCAVPARKSA
jgi:hypothetical protein